MSTKLRIFLALRLGADLPEVDALAELYADYEPIHFDSADASARLVIVNGGERWPMRQIDTLQFVADTPYETVLKYNPGESRRLLSPEICELLRGALIGVVESGSGRRIDGVFHGPGGEPIAVGGKTGTGDHLSKYFAAAGQLIEVKVENRNAIFTFFLADRFFRYRTAPRQVAALDTVVADGDCWPG